MKNPSNGKFRQSKNKEFFYGITPHIHEPIKNGVLTDPPFNSTTNQSSIIPKLTSAEIPTLIFNEMQTELPMAMSDHISYISNPTINYFDQQYMPLEISHSIETIRPTQEISFVLNPPEENPCSLGLSYVCFSAATADQCQQVCIFISLKFKMKGLKLKKK